MKLSTESPSQPASHLTLQSHIEPPKQPLESPRRIISHLTLSQPATQPASICLYGVVASLPLPVRTDACS
ncbi:hypothetical protein E2C01_069293 [Portunus trituberculatus]|uniref:Uncharacterized protein n=1 Tax=Portunus trituberculatus TaxID=210409 RepID=A0A5B7HY57_PORTR|nr:hypothetical protein [Portunus trituberculatus]